MNINNLSWSAPARRLRLLGPLLIATGLMLPTLPALGGVDGVASYYGKRFHGRKTASGTKFNMHSMTAAHKKWRFGTRVRVTNPANGNSVIVTVNDRGPYVHGRSIDLSYAAARELGMIQSGTARVKLERLGSRAKTSKTVSSKPARKIKTLDDVF